MRLITCSRIPTIIRLWFSVRVVGVCRREGAAPGGGGLALVLVLRVVDYVIIQYDVVDSTSKSQICGATWLSTEIMPFLFFDLYNHFFNVWLWWPELNWWPSSLPYSVSNGGKGYGGKPCTILDQIHFGVTRGMSTVVDNLLLADLEATMMARAIEDLIPSEVGPLHVEGLEAIITEVGTEMNDQLIRHCVCLTVLGRCFSSALKIYAWMFVIKF